MTQVLHAPRSCIQLVFFTSVFIMLLGQLFVRVDLIKPVSNVRTCVHMCVRPHDFEIGSK